MALTKFKRTLPWARLSVRNLTHTLHLPPAHAEIYYGPHVDWLREVLLRLPNLQSLIVRGLPFFDHGALNALKFLQKADTSDYRNVNDLTFGLRLLDASRCTNVTAASLSHALRRFQFMLYLDLSFTPPARDRQVLSNLREMTGLQVLKLRGISLRDEDVAVLATAIQRRVRSLDLRNNQLTDRSVRILAEHCLNTQPVASTSSLHTAQDRLLHYLGAEMLRIYRGEQFEGYIRKSFTTGFVNRLAIEDTPESGTGITHLYMSENQLTVEGVSGLLRSGGLNVLNVGAVKPDLSGHPICRADSPECTALPGAEKLVTVLHEAAQALTFLRIDHRLVTREPTSAVDDAEIIPGRAELADMPPSLPTEPVELPDSAVYELAAEPVYELPGDPIHILVTPVSEERPPIAGQRRGSAEAPEVVDPSKTSTECSLLPAYTDEAAVGGAAAGTQSNLPHRGRLRTYSSVVAERASRVKTHVSQSKGFHPGILPCLTTLVLTDVPPFAPSSTIADRVKALIHDCAEEERLAEMQARLDYSAPPGRKGYDSTVNQIALGIFPMKELVLEVARDVPRKRKGAASAWRHQDTKSVTQDRDSEALFSAAETDFSFFGEYDHDLPSLESLPAPTTSGLEVCAPKVQNDPPAWSMRKEDEVNAQPRLDVIAAIAVFRKAKKEVYHAQVASGDTQPHVDGLWNGNVKVIRPSRINNPMDEDDEVLADYYGNVFTNSYLYR